MSENIENNYPEEFTIPIWDGNPLPIQPNQGHTPWGYYDNDSLFRADAVKFSLWAAIKLGYPITDVEMQSGSFYACYEEAINEYSSIVNMFNIQDNLLTLQGSEYSNQMNISQKVINPNLARIIDISAEYGAEGGVGGNITWRQGYFETMDGQQVYDLETAVSNSLVAQGITDVDSIKNNVEIKRVFHQNVPASNRYFNPFIGSGNQYLMNSFGWNNIAGVNYVMMPMYSDVLRIQAIELSDTIRKSAYSFEIINNQIRIFPVPQGLRRIFFDYIIKTERSIPYKQGLTEDKQFISDASNVPYNLMKYSNINMSGRQWIARWGAALSKELLGSIRSKYQTIPSLNQDVTLDGSDLKTQAQTEKEQLLTQIREDLDKLTRTSLLKAKAEEAESLQDVLNRVPLLIYVG